MLSAELKSFHMVARLGSITQAAKKLGLSQPTVTTQIRSLESQYGVELFYRGGRRLTLSDEGARLLPMVQKLQQQEADIEFFLRNSGQVQGTLRIGATAPYYVLDMVRDFREQFPQCEVTLEIGNSLQVIEALEEYRVDLAARGRALAARAGVFPTPVRAGRTPCAGQTLPVLAGRCVPGWAEPGEPADAGLAGRADDGNRGGGVRGRSLVCRQPAPAPLGRSGQGAGLAAARSRRVAATGLAGAPCCAAGLRRVRRSCVLRR